MESDLELSDDECDDTSETDIHAQRYCKSVSIFFLSWQYKFGLPDSAVGALLLFLSMFFSTLNVVIKSPIISALAKNLPKSVKRCRKILQISDKVFEKYVSCVRCHSIYEFEECIDKGLRGKRAVNIKHIQIIHKQCIVNHVEHFFLKR